MKFIKVVQPSGTTYALVQHMPPFFQRTNDVNQANLWAQTYGNAKIVSDAAWAEATGNLLSLGNLAWKALNA